MVLLRTYIIVIHFHYFLKQQITHFHAYKPHGILNIISNIKKNIYISNIYSTTKKNLKNTNQKH